MRGAGSASRDANDGTLYASEIMDWDLSSVELLVLSACETGQVSDEKFRDESIHLISAYQLAGFRHVIGTLWSVDDLACVDMAREFYGVLLKAGFSDESVCRGLHAAHRKLRDNALRVRARRAAEAATERDSMEKDEWEAGRGKRKVKVDDSTDDGLGDKGATAWIPYVHFGV